MKNSKTLLLGLLLMASSAAQAQTEAESRLAVTPHVGVNMWSARFLGFPWANDPKTDVKPGLTLGAAIDYKFADHFAVGSGLDLSMLRYGRTLETSNSDGCKLTMTGLAADVPVTLGFTPVRGLWLKTGIQLRFQLNKPKTDFHFSTIQNNTTIVSGTEQSGSIKTTFDPFEWALPLELSYSYSRFVLSAKMAYSLRKFDYEDRIIPHQPITTNIVTNKSTVNKHTATFLLTLGYKLPL